MLPASADKGVQLATGTFAVLLVEVEHVVATKLLPETAPAGKQLATGTAEVVAVRQVVVV